MAHQVSSQGPVREDLILRQTGSCWKISGSQKSKISNSSTDLRKKSLLPRYNHRSNIPIRLWMKSYDHLNQTSSVTPCKWYRLFLNISKMQFWLLKFATLDSKRTQQKSLRFKYTFYTNMLSFPHSPISGIRSTLCNRNIFLIPAENNITVNISGVTCTTNASKHLVTSG